MALGRTNLFCVEYLYCSHSSLNQIYRPQFLEASGTAEHSICSASTCNYASPTHLLASSHENTGGAACRGGPIVFSTLPAIMMLFRYGLTPIHFSKKKKKKHRADQCPGSQIEILKTTTKSITQDTGRRASAHGKRPQTSYQIKSYHETEKKAKGNNKDNSNDNRQNHPPKTATTLQRSRHRMSSLALLQKDQNKSTNLQSQQDHPSFNCFALAEREAWPEGPAHELLSPSLLQPHFNINT